MITIINGESYQQTHQKIVNYPIMSHPMTYKQTDFKR